MLRIPGCEFLRLSRLFTLEKPLFRYVAVLDAQGLPIYPVLTPRKWSCLIVYALFVGYQWLLFLGWQRLADAVLST